MSRPGEAEQQPQGSSQSSAAPLADSGRAEVAAFDFDGTLTDRGSVWQFLVAMVGWQSVILSACAVAPRLVLAALLGGNHADDAKEALFRRTLGGRRLDEVAPKAAAFGLSYYRAHARTDVRARLDWHKSQGHRVVIISASPEIYVRPVGEELGVDAVLATRLEVGTGGLLTGNYDGRNCRGSEKISRLREWMTATAGDASAPFLWAYGNSGGDARLLDAADVGVDVGRLGRFGKLRRFRRLAAVDSAR